MKIQDIFKLNLSTRGGVTLFDKIANRYNLIKSERKELTNNLKSSDSSNYIYLNVEGLEYYTKAPIVSLSDTVYMQTDGEVIMTSTGYLLIQPDQISTFIPVITKIRIDLNTICYHPYLGNISIEEFALQIFDVNLNDYPHITKEEFYSLN